MQPARARSILRWTMVLALWGLITHGTYAGTGDEPHYLAIAHSIAFDGDVDLADNYGANEPLIAGGGLRMEAHVQPGVGGAMRPVHDIGLPLVFAPYVRIAVPVTHALIRVVPASVLQRARLNPPVLYRHLLSLAMIALAVVLAGMLFESFLALGGSNGAALVTALLVALSPPLLIFSVLFFTELLSALIAFALFRRMTLMETDGKWQWLAMGCATGFLFLLHAKNIGLIIPFVAIGLYVLRASERRREAMAFVLGAGVMVLARTMVNWHFWGSPVSGPHARFALAAGEGMVGEVLVRLAGLSVDQEFGLLPYAPLYVLAIVGAFALARIDRRLTMAIAAVVVFYVALIVCPLINVHGWTGGWNPAARFLTPIVPLLGLLVFAGLRATPRVAALPVLILQVGITAYAWQHPKILWNDGDGRAAFCEITGSGICGRLPSLASRKVAGTFPAKAPATAGGGLMTAHGWQGLRASATGWYARSARPATASTARSSPPLRWRPSAAAP